MARARGARPAAFPAVPVMAIALILVAGIYTSATTDPGIGAALIIGLVLVLVLVVGLSGGRER